MDYRLHILIGAGVSPRILAPWLWRRQHWHRLNYFDGPILDLKDDDRLLILSFATNFKYISHISSSKNVKNQNGSGEKYED
jgi:hypothetical protein